MSPDQRRTNAPLHCSLPSPMTHALPWLSLPRASQSCQVDLVKDGGHLYFIKCLEQPSPPPPADTQLQAQFQSPHLSHLHAQSGQGKALPLHSPSPSPSPPAHLSDPKESATVAFQRAMAAFVLALVCEGNPRGHAACLQVRRVRGGEDR